MPYIIPNTTAIPQTVSTPQIVVNGTTCTWPTDKIVEGVKVIHHIECSIGCENTGTVSAELKFSLQRDIGSGWENVAGEVACYTIAAGDDARRKANFKIPYYNGISGFAPRYRLLAECPAGEVTLHRAEGRNAVPTVTGKIEHEFEGDAPSVLVDVILAVADWDSASLHTTPIKYPLYNAFSPVLPGNIVVQFSQGQSQTDKFESIVSVVSEIPIETTSITSGTYQQWNDPGNLSGQAFEDSAFVWAGGNRVFCRFGNFASTFAWLVDPNTKSMTEITLPAEIYPSGYDRPLNCQRAYAVYSPSANKVAMLYQQASGDLDMYVVSAQITDTGAVVDTIPTTPIWQGNVEYVNVASLIAGGAVGPNGKIVYAADLYNNSTYRCALLSADISGSTPVMGYDVTFAPSEAAHVVPVAIAGSKDVEEFVLFFADTTTSIFAAKFDSAGQQIGSVLAVDTGLGNDRQRGKAVWLTGANQIVFTFGSDSDGILREYVINSTPTGLEIAASDEHSSEYASAYCDIGESTNMLISSNLRKQSGLQPNEIRTRKISGIYPVSISSGIASSVSVDINNYKFFMINSEPADTTLTVDLTGLTGDLDLYVKAGSVATRSNYDSASENVGLANEQVVIANSGATQWFICVFGYEAGNASLTATLS